MNDKLTQALQRNRTATLKPPSDLPLSVWAERYFKLSAESSSMPGSIKLFEFQKEVLDTIQNPKYKRIVLEAASQILKTQSLLIFLAHSIENDPAPTLMVQPSTMMR